MKQLLAAAALLVLSILAPMSQEPTSLGQTVAIGEPIYVQRCKECHGATGNGFVGPKLAGNARLANAEFVLRQITKGSADMPAFGKRLTPEELLAVADYVRNSWGNAHGFTAAPAQEP